jgi:hypothetical protein
MASALLPSGFLQQHQARIAGRIGAHVAGAHHAVVLFVTQRLLAMLGLASSS